MPTKTNKPEAETPAPVQRPEDKVLDRIVERLTNTLNSPELAAQKRAEVARIEGFYEGYQTSIREMLHLIKDMANTAK